MTENVYEWDRRIVESLTRGEAREAEESRQREEDAGRRMWQHVSARRTAAPLETTSCACMYVRSFKHT